MQKRIRFSLNPQTRPTAPDTDPGVRYGILEEPLVYEVPSLWSDERGAAHPFEAVRLLPPCWPSKILCVGRNYLEHARELGNQPLAEPLIFLKPPSALLAHGGAIEYPAVSGRLDYEGELGVVIGRRARRVRPEDADSVIYGYTCVNDVTARDLQRKDGQWTRGKGHDTFCPVGPWIVPRAGFDPGAAGLRTLLNGQVRQDAPFRDMIFSLAAIITYITSFLTLEPGDLIATGTPSGVGPMSPGDQVSVEIRGIGTLLNHVVRE